MAPLLLTFTQRFGFLPGIRGETGELTGFQGGLYDGDLPRVSGRR